MVDLGEVLIHSLHPYAHTYSKLTYNIRILCAHEFSFVKGFYIVFQPFESLVILSRALLMVGITVAYKNFL